MTGYVTADWQTLFGYAYTDARITSDTSATIVAGNRVQLVPYNQFSLVEQVSDRLRLGRFARHHLLLGLLCLVRRQREAAGLRRFDAGLFAKIDETWSAQLNVENIFNKGYWATADGNNNLSPGQGRTVRVLARARFLARLSSPDGRRQNRRNPAKARSHEATCSDRRSPATPGRRQSPRQGRSRAIDLRVGDQPNAGPGV